jgi:hypothetical protein
MRFVLLHYHIFKNAGSTVEDYLDLSFGECFQRIDTPDPNGTVPESEILELLNANPHLQALSSHQFRYPMPVARGILFFDCCFLRDPLQRIQSTYRYLREKPVHGDPLSDLANSRAVGDFVEELLETAPHRISNVQTNLLANGSVHAEAAREEWLDRALARMHETSCIGVVDRFEHSIAAAHFLLSPIFPRLVPRAPGPVNASSDPQTPSSKRPQSLKELCAPSFYAELVRRNGLDLELLEQTRREVARRFERIPSSHLPSLLMERQLQSVE